jgi:hypothetical protein
MSYQERLEMSHIKKGTPFKLSVRGHNNFFYPSEEVFHAQKDISYDKVGWLSFDGLKPVKVQSKDLSAAEFLEINEKFAVIWITI